MVLQKLPSALGEGHERGPTVTFHRRHGANEAGTAQPFQVTGSEIPERDLSVQLSGWMLMEAAHAVTVKEGTSNE